MTQQPNRRYRRAPVVRIYDVGTRMVLVRPDGSARELLDDSARLARALLEFATVSRSRQEILSYVEQNSESALDETSVGVIDELLTLLVERGALTEIDDTEAPSVTPSRATHRLVLCLTGAVATMHAPALVLLLQRRGFEVRIAATVAALRFVRREALEALLHERVLSDLFDKDQDLYVPHIDLARWADVVLVYPASATTLSRLATGDYSTLVSAIALTARVPVVVVPSMNAGMLESPATRRNLEQLVADGLYVVQPAAGIELADRPGEREPRLGPAPPHAVVVQLVETILARRPPAACEPQARRCQKAEDWERCYAESAPHELPWHSERIDPDIARQIDAHQGSLSLLDVGTGTGVVAVEAAGRGHRVVGTDISRAALALALKAARTKLSPRQAASILWIEDDITASRLHGVFDMVIDRGCLHVLEESVVPAYARSIERLTSESAVLVLKTHAESEARLCGTTAYSAERIQAVFGRAFELVSDEASDFPGPTHDEGAPPRAARLFILRRRAQGETPLSNASSAGFMPVE